MPPNRNAPRRSAPNRNVPNRNAPSRNALNRPSARRDTRNNTGGKSNDTLAALAAVGLIAVLGAVAFFLLRGHSDAPKLDLLVGADVTNSVGTGDRQKLFGILDETVDQALPKGSDVSLWAFDVNAHKISDKTPRKSEDLWPDEDQCIAHKQNAQGTYPAVALKDMTGAAQQAQDRGENVALMLLTDGEDTDTNKKDLEDAATKLAGMSSVKALWVAGASTENGFRSTLERRLGPIFGNKLVLSSNGDAQDGLNKFRALIAKK